MKLRHGHDEFHDVKRKNKDAARELDIHNFLANIEEKCPYIITTYNVSPFYGSNFHVAMEYYTDGDLFEYVQELKDVGILMEEDEVRRIFKQMALSVKFLHDRKIVHRDLKLENFVVMKDPSPRYSAQGDKFSRIDHVKLIDFGHTSHFKENQVFSEVLGTDIYRPPEIFDCGDFRCAYHAPPADIYALGISLFMILEAAHPKHHGQSNLRFFSERKSHVEETNPKENLLYFARCDEQNCI